MVFEVFQYPLIIVMVTIQWLKPNNGCHYNAWYLHLGLLLFMNIL